MFSGRHGSIVPKQAEERSGQPQSVRPTTELRRGAGASRSTSAASLRRIEPGTVSIEVITSAEHKFSLTSLSCTLVEAKVAPNIARRPCTVVGQDSDGNPIQVRIEAESLYEAAARGMDAIRESGGKIRLQNRSTNAALRRTRTSRGCVFHKRQSGALTGVFGTQFLRRAEPIFFLAIRLDSHALARGYEPAERCLHG